MTGTSERQVPAGKLSRASSLVYGRSLCVDFSRLNRATRWRLAGGRAYNPSSFGIGAEPGHQENRRPRTSVPTEASGWRSTVRRSIARLVPQPGQKTSSHGVPAISAARMVGDQSMSRPVAKRRFQRSMTSSASRRAARSAFSLAAPAWVSSPRVLAIRSGYSLGAVTRALDLAGYDIRQRT
jgi:hypothetical protein